MGQQVNTIVLGGYGHNPDALMHMQRTPAQRKAEIKDLEKHIDHLQNSGKPVDKKYFSEMDTFEKSLTYLNGNFMEMKIWSRNSVNVGDLIEFPFNRKGYTVNKIVKIEDHTGFQSIADQKQTFYTLVVTCTGMLR